MPATQFTDNPNAATVAHDNTEEVQENNENQEQQVIAQVVQAGEPRLDGTRRVVLLLPDGNLMQTEVSAEQYAELDLDA